MDCIEIAIVITCTVCWLIDPAIETTGVHTQPIFKVSHVVTS